MTQPVPLGPDTVRDTKNALEMAHVLFMDVVAYSTLSMDEQRKILNELQEIVLSSATVGHARNDDMLIALPTGDGMALVFFGDPKLPVLCALELTGTLRQHPAIRLRMGIHSGPVYRVADINAARNVAGGGINLAQRVMDCGDAGHILVSEEVGKVLAQINQRWRESLRDLGMAEVKHGVRLHIYNLVTPDAGNATLPKKIRAARARARKRKAVLWLGAALVVALAIGGYRYRKRQAHALTQTDTLVLADFVNRTGDPVFDDTLKHALSVGLAQSPFFNILSDQKVAATLRMMMKSPDTPLTAGVSREVCQRAGGKAMIVGTIATLGTDYVLTLDAVHCADGDLIAQKMAQATGKEKVLDALNDATTRLRRKLGESMATLQKFDVPLAQATTPSLDALKDYTLADQSLHAKDDLAGAIGLYKRAIDLDPDFAEAYIGLATSYWNLGELEPAAQSARKAFELRDRVSERAKLSIETLYQFQFTGNLQAAEETLRLQTQTYPRDASGFANLGVVHSKLGQHEQAVADASHALSLDPVRAITYANLANSYQNINHIDEARTTLAQARKLGLDPPVFRWRDYALDFLQNDGSEMAQVLAWASGKPGLDDQFFSLQACTDAYFGRMDKAHELTAQSVTRALQQQEKEDAAAHKALGALSDALVGNFAIARKEAKEALTLSKGREVRPIAATALALTGDPHALSVAAELEKDYPEDTIQKLKYIPTIRAAVEINRDHPANAIELLQSALSIDFGDSGSFSLYSVYVRGQAYLALHQGSAAAGEFEKIIAHRGIVMNEPIGAPAHLGIARANALDARNIRGVDADAGRARALGGYKEFLTLWKAADTDVPIYSKAKAECAQLQLSACGT